MKKQKKKTRGKWREKDFVVRNRHSWSWLLFECTKASGKKWPTYRRNDDDTSFIFITDQVMSVA